MYTTRIAGSLVLAGIVAAFATASVAYAAAPPQASAPVAPRAYNAIDLTGTWVSVVTEDWRWRMVTPPKGDYASLPLTREGRAVADTWDVAQDGSCLAYGAAGLLRMPTRLRITWESDSILRLETDAGQQTRRFVFGAGANASAPSLQGYSQSRWLPDVPVPENPTNPTNGEGGSAPSLRTATNPTMMHSTLEVQTTGLSGGWLRRNGVPYSADAVVTEYFSQFASPNGDQWMVVTVIVNDPKYLSDPFITSSHFKREADDSKWHPRPCRA